MKELEVADLKVLRMIKDMSRIYQSRFGCGCGLDALLENLDYEGLVMAKVCRFS